MIRINDHTVAVENEGDLREALGNDNGIDYVYFAVNITLTTELAIYAGANKTSLVIDGFYNNTTHSFTDMDSTLPTSTLGIGAASSIAITFKNMTITGRNFYGIPHIWEIPDTANLSLTYENVNYTGPQLAYNWNGLTRFVNCDITIQQNGVAQAQEAGEINRVEFDGTVNIQHNTTANHSVFYFHGNANTAAFTVLPGANVTITTVNNYFMYNVFPFPLIQIPVRYTIGAGASFTLNVNKGISFDSNHIMASFLVDENASFRYSQTASNGSSAALYINGALTVNKGASFYMRANNNAAPLVWFTADSARRFSVANPKSFVLYSRNAAALYFTNTTDFSLSGGQLNYWPAATTSLEDAGTFDDAPQHKWFKKDYAVALELSGTAASGATTVASNNILPEDQPLPPLSNLHLHDARVLSLGDIPLAVNTVVDDQTPVTGTTEPNAKVMVEYTVEGVNRKIRDAAGSDGRFSVLTPEPVPYTTPVKVSVNVPFLIRELTTVSQKAGELSIDSAPTLIQFVTPPVSLSPLLLRRKTPVIPVKVLDSRVYSTEWELMASIDGPMHTQSGYTLPDGVVFKDAGDMLPLRTDVALAVHTGGPAVPETDVEWNEDEGILLHVTAPLHNGEAYTARLTWEVHPV